MLTDQISQIHRSPGFITSNLIGKREEDGAVIQEFEASHGTVTDLWRAHLAGKETSMNPLGLAEALIGAMSHSARCDARPEADVERLLLFTDDLRHALHETFAVGEGTRDMMGPTGKTTEEFVEAVSKRLDE
jgi:isocitrate dehydrogenase